MSTKKRGDVVFKFRAKWARHVDIPHFSAIRWEGVHIEPLNGLHLFLLTRHETGCFHMSAIQCGPFLRTEKHKWDMRRGSA